MNLIRNLICAVAVCLMGGVSYAQTTYGQLSFQLQTTLGVAVAGATINVYTQSACGVATTGTVATLYPTAQGGTPLTQPLSTDGYGSGTAYAAQGCYTVVYSSPQTGTRTFIDQNAIAASAIISSGSGINQLTGDVTAGPGVGSQVTTLATVNGSPGTCGDATHTCQVTTNGKGLTTGQSSVAITFPSVPFQSLTTTGSSGAATLLAGVLNIPNYTSPFQSLTTIGSSGAATLLDGVLNIPSYSGGGGSSPIPSNASFVWVCTSDCDDDDTVLASAVTLTAWSTSAGTTTFTNSGNNHFTAGQWVSLRYATSWPSCSGFGAGTNCTLFQVESSGLSATQFKVNTSAISAGTCSSSCGSAYSASHYLPFATASLPAMPSGAYAATTSYVILTSQAVSGYNTLIHPFSPAVTGNPAYFIIDTTNNDAGSCPTVSTITGYLQTLYEDAHNDGFTVVQTTGHGTDWAPLCGQLTAYAAQYHIDQFMRESGYNSVTATSSSSTDYWDILADVHSALPDGSNANLIEDGEVLTGAGVDSFARVVVAAMVNGSGTFETGNPIWYIGNGASAPGSTGFTFIPSISTGIDFMWQNSAVTSWEMAESGGNVDIKGYLNVTASSPIAACPGGRPFCVDGVFNVDTDGTLWGVKAINITTGGSHSNCWDTDGGVITNCAPGAGGGGSSGSVLINGLNNGTYNILGVTGFYCTDTSGSGTAQACVTETPSNLYFTPQTGNCITFITSTTNSGTGLTLDVNDTTAAAVSVFVAGSWTTTLSASMIPTGHPILACQNASSGWDFHLN